MSFDLTFTRLGHKWYAQIVPSWYYSRNGLSISRWHEDLLSKQKRLENNQAVRNYVRFIAFFLANLGDIESIGLRFKALLEFNAEYNGAADISRDSEADDNDGEGEAAA